MKISNKFIVTLVILLITKFHRSITASSSASVEDGIPHFSTQEKRLLNTNCATFLHDGSAWYVDGDNSKQTLQDACDPNVSPGAALDCCNNSGGVNNNGVCTNWNPAVSYTICGGSCQGQQACSGIAQSVLGGSVKINENACKGGVGTCSDIGWNIPAIVDIEIGQNACTSNDYACSRLGRNAQSVTSIKVPDNECNEANTATSTNVDGNIAAKCDDCGLNSVFDGIFQATDACCAADGEYYGQGDGKDEACNYTPPEEPNPCKNLSCSNRGKCQVLSLTEAECKCENTFIQSENKLDCICPSNHEFHADANRCFPITEAPSKSSTMSPTKTSSASPSQVPTTSQDDVCEDDETASFELINRKGTYQPCSWITKNWKKRDNRKENYCGLDYVKANCPATCGLCSK